MFSFFGNQRAKGVIWARSRSQPNSASTGASACVSASIARAAAARSASICPASPSARPVSSSVSRTAAIWWAASSTGMAARTAISSPRAKSAGSTRPPGNTAMPPAKDMLRERTVISTSGAPPAGALRKMIMVAAGMPWAWESVLITGQHGATGGACQARRHNPAALERSVGLLYTSPSSARIDGPKNP